MSSKHPTQANKPPPMRGIIIEPPRDVEASAPPLANYVTVRGGADCAVLEFYYIPPRRWTEFHAAREANSDGGMLGIERIGDVGVARVPPVARVSLPFLSAAELVTSLIELAAESMGDLRDDGPALLARVAAAAGLIQRVGEGVRAATPPSEGKP